MANKTRTEVEIATKMVGLEAASAKVKAFTTRFTSLTAALKTGFGVEAWRMGTRAFFAMTNAIQQTIRTGLEFNAMLETNKISMAAVLRSTLPERFRTFNSALEASVGLFEQVRKGAVDAGISIGAAGEVFAATTGMMTRNNIPLEKQARLMTLVMRATKTMGLTSQIQLFQEARAMFMGENLRGALVAQSSGMTTTGLKQAAQAGNLDQYIEEKLSGFLESADALSESFNVLTAKVKVAGQELAGESMSGFQQDIKFALSDLTWSMNRAGGLVRVASGASREGMGGPDLSMNMYKLMNDIRSGQIPWVMDFMRNNGGFRQGSREWYAQKLMERGWSENAAYREYDQFDFARTHTVNDWGMWNSDSGGESEAAMLSFLENVFAEEKSKKRKSASLVNSMLSTALTMPAGAGMASRGLYGSSGVANYYQRSLSIQQSMLDQLKQVAKNTREVVKAF